MGDAERDIFWLGTAFQSLYTIAKTNGLAKGKGSLLDVLGQTIGALRRLEVSGNLSAQVQRWAGHFRENYGASDTIREEDKPEFIETCEDWIRSFSDLMKERYAHPKELYEAIPKIDHILGSVKQIQTAEHQFVCTSPTVRHIRERVTQAIETAQSLDQILLTGYFDFALVDRLVNALGRGVQARLIVPRYRERERDNITATRRVRDAGAEVRQHDTNHARLMVFGNSSALVSSADPKTDGLDQNFEAGIWTTNRTIIQECIDFFQILWEESIVWDMHPS